MGKQGISKLTVNEAAGDFTHVLVLDYNDIIAAGTTATEFATIPAGGAVDVAVVYEETALAGATDITLDVGTTSSDPNEFIKDLDVDNMSAPVANTGSDLAAGSAAATTIKGGSLPVALTQSDTKVYYKFGGTTGDLTAGKVIIGLRIFDLGRFA